MTCSFTDGLDPELGKAMIEQHWAANGSCVSADGQHEVSPKITAVPAKDAVTSVSGPPPLALDFQECDDPRWDQNRRTY